jgi:hypothetical protein
MVRRTLYAAAALAALVLPFAAMADDKEDPMRAKIERAKAAGAYIHPEVERKWLSGEAAFPKFMDEPEKVKAVRPSPPGFTRYGVIPIPPEARAEMAKARAEAEARGMTEADLERQANRAGLEPGDEDAPDDEEGDRRLTTAPWCALRASYPYRAAGLAQGDASHECYQAIQRHELYGQLLKWYCYSDSRGCQWVQMVTDFAAKGVPNAAQKIATHPRYDCVKLDVERYWRHRADAYTQDRFGTWYGPDVRDHQDRFQCG